MGISFNQGVPYGGDLDMGQCLALTKTKPTLKILENVDPELAKNLEFIK